MSSNSYYESIFRRKSVRKYDMAKLEDETLKDISDKLAVLEPFYPEIKTDFKLVMEKDVTASVLFKIPYYIVAFSETREGYLTNIGFMLQQMDLYLSSKGLGCCWVGLAKPSKEVLESTELEFVIVMAFGKPAEPLYRRDTAEFKRKALKEITDIPDAGEMFEPVRLAPSARNSQPWFFTGTLNMIHTYGIKANFIKALFMDKFNKIDMGISLCHLWIAAKHAGKNIEFIYNSSVKADTPSGKYYITSVKIGE